MKLITYLMTILMISGSYTSLRGDCKDGSAICNDNLLVTWPCTYHFPWGCYPRDYKTDSAAAGALCADHQGVKTSTVRECSI